jgi:hypothetical protein
VDVSANPDMKIKNSAIYFYMKIPIGVGKKQNKTKYLFYWI